MLQLQQEVQAEQGGNAAPSAVTLSVSPAQLTAEDIHTSETGDIPSSLVHAPDFHPSQGCIQAAPPPNPHASVDM